VIPLLGMVLVEEVFGWLHVVSMSDEMRVFVYCGMNPTLWIMHPLDS